MNISNQIFVIDVNIIIHIEKAGLLDELINDDRICIVDLVLYDEYEHKKNLFSEKVSNIKIIRVSEKQINNALNLYNKNKRNSFYDYCSYVVANDNNYSLLTGDFKLKKFISSNINVYGAIWYVQDLERKKIITKKQLKKAYETWLNDTTVYMPNELLSKLISQLENQEQSVTNN